MIKPHCFTKSWIDGFRQKTEFAGLNPPVCEKMIFALHLVELLAGSQLNFVFKGGTSLVLLMKEARRFSIDVDIITDADKGDVEEVLNEITTEGRFKKWRSDTKRSLNTSVPKVHYELEYNSGFNKTSNKILLDVLNQSNLYPNLTRVPVNSSCIDVDEPIYVIAPDIESILGDKLSAFAPNTTGIQYNRGKSLEIIKQLFDIGNLFDYSENLDIVRQSFKAFAAAEASYKNLNIRDSEVLDDILETSRLLALRDRNKTEPQKGRFYELQQGIKAMNSFLMKGNFNIDQAISAAAKAALLSVLIKNPDLHAIVKFNPSNREKADILHPEWNFLNHLKKLPDQSAFFYWKQTVDHIYPFV